jgi:hypothetical protein
MFFSLYAGIIIILYAKYCPVAVIRSFWKKRFLLYDMSSVQVDYYAPALF